MTDATHGWLCLEAIDIDDARIGVHPHEHRRRQPLRIDVALWIPVAVAARSDHLRDTPDWSQVLQTVQQVVGSRHYNLVETLSEALAAHLLERFAVGRVQVKICKVGCLSHGRAAIQIERCR